MRFAHERILALTLGGMLLVPPMLSQGYFLDPLSEASDRVAEMLTPTAGDAVPAEPRIVADRELANRARALLERSGEIPPPAAELLPSISYARDAAVRHGVPVSIVLAVIHHESRFQERAVSPMGAVGLMQVQPATARAVARDQGLPAPRRADLMEPETNIEIGVALLRALKDEYGSWDRALAVYNAGPAGIAGGGIRADVGPYVRGVKRGAKFLSSPPAPGEAGGSA